MENEGIGGLNQPDSRNKKPENDNNPEMRRDDRQPAADSIEFAEGENQVTEDSYSSQSSEKGKTDAAVSGETSGEMTESDTPEDVVGYPRHSRQPSAPKIRYEKVEDARQKLAEGFYDNPVNYWVIVDKIINYLGFK